MQLISKDLQLTVSTEIPSIELHSRRLPGAYFQSQFEINCQVGGTNINLLMPTRSIQFIETKQSPGTPPCISKTTSFHIDTDNPGVRATVQIGVSRDEPMAYFQMSLKNNSNSPLIIHRITPLIIKPGNLHFSEKETQNPAFFSNGWQSWSSSGAYGLGDKQRNSILGRFQNPMIINPGTPQPNNRHHFTADMFGVLGDRTQRVGVLAGFLSQKQHFGSLETRFNPELSMTMWANGDGVSIPPGKSTQTDWAMVGFVDLDAAEPLNTYFKAVAREHNIKTEASVPVGWCSWYHFYDDITEKDIKANLESVVALKPELPLPLLQIDDGFETYPGDWFDFDPGFPQSLTPLVNQTKAAGLIPGIWLAPYIVHPKANLVKEHPEWLLRDKKGKPVNAGFVWNAFNFALDLTHPEALKYTCDVIRTAVETWGFEYLKLDFLYAAALEGVYQDPSQTRAQVLRTGLTALREAAGPEVTMLACGCPLGSALGLFEAMRISADVSGHWKPHFPPLSPFLKKEPHMPAARNALQNILSRAPLHRHWWINDPDCLLVRPDTDLTLAEVQTLASAIGLTGGSLLLSDDLPALPKDRLRMAQVLLPVIDRRPQVLDWFENETPARLRVDLSGPTGAWHLLGLFNWENKPASLQFSPQDYKLPFDQVWWLREFWTGMIGQMSRESPFIFHDVPPHGVRVIAARPYQANLPTYLGSDLHLSQGLEISAWQAEDHQVSLRIGLGRRASGSLVVYLPWQPTGAIFNESAQIIKNKGRGIYRIDVQDVDGQTLIITK
jgi:alpha-galactosidase